MKKQKKILSILLVLFAFAGVTQELPQASFTINQNSQCTPTTVSFTNTSQGDSLNYHWDLGNGNTSQLENPQVIYNQAGTYTVSLIISNNRTGDTLTIQDAVNIYNKPEINLTKLGNEAGCAPFNRSFSANDSNQENTEFRWDFGTGEILHGDSVNINFVNSGEYNLLITAINEHACIQTKYYEQVAKAFANPEIQISADNNTFCNKNPEVNFSLQTNDNLVSHEWNFGDNSSSIEMNPKHVFNTQGSFDITCTITNENNCSSSITENNMIEIAPVIANFILEDSISCSSKINIQNLSSAFRYIEWNFGDGATSTQVNPQHEYSEPGNYIITLRAWNDDGCEDIISKRVIVDFTTADFISSEETFCDYPEIIRYTSQSVNAVSWQYYLGSGHVFNTENPTDYVQESNLQNTNNSMTNLHDTLIVTSQYGCIDTVVKPNNNKLIQPKAYFTPNDLPGQNQFAKGCIPFTVEFNEASFYENSEDDIISYHWDFGDGTSSEEQHPSHTWNQVGEYEVSLSIETIQGCTSTFNSIIQVGSPQTADFSLIAEDTVCASDFIQLMNHSTNTEFVDEWRWRFSDGGISMAPNPSYHFTDTGYMDIALVVGYNGCMSEPAVLNDAVYVKGPVAEFSYRYDCETPLAYNFHADVIEADYWYWDLGDGTTGFDNETEIHHEYAESGNYRVKIISENSENTCQYTYRKTVKPRDLQAIISADTTLGCPGLTVHFDADQSKFAIPTEHENSWGKYRWIIDNSNIDTILNTGFTHQFNTAGTHEIKLIVKDRNGCVDTATQLIQIFGIDGNITTNNLSGCAPLNINFDAEIISDTTIVSHRWDFDDNFFSEETTPSHIYSIGGNYQPKLTVTDALGCQSNITYDEVLVSIQPSVDFIVSKRNVCSGDVVTFKAHQQNEHLNYQWTFGNGETSYESLTDVQYVNSGLYDVSLSVQDSNQCTNQLTKSDFISVEDYPTADFTADRVLSSCYPFEVNFFNNSSEHVTEQNWNFGGIETISTIENPTYTYRQPGNYDVSFIVSTENGCSDTLIKESYIKIGGPTADIIAPEFACQGSNINLSLDNEQNIYSAIWDMGNGQLMNGIIVDYSYSLSGNYHPIVLLKSDANGTCNKVIELDIAIPFIEATFSEKSQNLCLGEQVEIENQSIGADSYQWSFGDGHFSNLADPNHTYLDPGTYETALVAKVYLENGTACTDTATHQIKIFPNPESNFSFIIDNPRACELPKHVSFHNESIRAETYEWLFDNKRPTHSISNANNPTYLYQTAGEHMVTLISTNQFSCTDTITKTVNILPIIDAEFEISETVGCEPLSINFINRTSFNQDKDKIIATHFFINGEPASNNLNLMHGNYDVSMITKTSNGCIDSIIKENIILVHQNPSAKFSMQSNDNINQPENYGEVSFQNESNAFSSTYTIHWEFGDGYQSNELNPIHQYDSYADYTGEAYQAELTITNEHGCQDTKTQSVSMDYFNGLFVPNAIIPEYGTGEQQVFLPKGKSLSSYQLTIYNRNGKLVFESSAIDPFDGSPLNGWDGKINGQYADQGVYVWQIDAEFTDGSTWSYKNKSGKPKQTGTLTVIR